MAFCASSAGLNTSRQLNHEEDDTAFFLGTQEWLSANQMLHVVLILPLIGPLLENSFHLDRKLDSFMLPLVTPKMGQFYVTSYLTEIGTVLCYQLFDRNRDSFMLPVV